MPIVRASRAYQVGEQTFNVAMANAERTLKVTLTREAWPAGPVISASIVWDNGAGLSVEFNGGVQMIYGRDPQGPNMVPALTNEFTVTKPEGVTQGTVTVRVLQPLTTSLLVVNE